MTNYPLKTLKLKSVSHSSFFISALTEEQKNLILKHKKENTIEEANGRLGIDCSQIFLIGATSKLNTSNMEKYIGFFRGPDTGKLDRYERTTRAIHYRDYTYTEERQESTVWLVNICPDLRMSLNSLQKAITTEYCCIWKTSN